EDLDFAGPRFGFRHVPDQYSLNYTFTRYLSQLRRPVFLFFITLSSHAPWNSVPPLETDWHRLSPEYGGVSADDNLSAELHDTYRQRFGQPEGSGLTIQDYFTHIEYEIRVIRRYIKDHGRSNSVFILVGDHQPPFFNEAKDVFYTPIHIISDNPEFLNPLLSRGFQKGMYPSQHQKNYMNHEGIYSLLVVALKNTYGKQVPVANVQYRPRGVPLSIITK
ncbi:MAG: hypothetical protein WAN36_02365, partial [Calditrichia bacterium]